MTARLSCFYSSVCHPTAHLLPLLKLLLFFIFSCIQFITLYKNSVTYFFPFLLLIYIYFKLIILLLQIDCSFPYKPFHYFPQWPSFFLYFLNWSFSSLLLPNQRKINIKLYGGLSLLRMWMTKLYSLYMTKLYGDPHCEISL